MDSAQIIVTVGGGALILFTLWFFFAKRDETPEEKSVDEKAAYACPMHPWITSDDPAATCSICGMKLTER